MREGSLQSSAHPLSFHLIAYTIPVSQAYHFHSETMVAGIAVPNSSAMAIAAVALVDPSLLDFMLFDKRNLQHWHYL